MLLAAPTCPPVCTYDTRGSERKGSTVFSISPPPSPSSEITSVHEVSVCEKTDSIALARNWGRPCAGMRTSTVALGLDSLELKSLGTDWGMRTLSRRGCVIRTIPHDAFTLVGAAIGSIKVGLIVVRDCKSAPRL